MDLAVLVLNAASNIWSAHFQNSGSVMRNGSTSIEYGMSETIQEIEEDIRREEAEDEYQGTRTQAEAPQMKKADPRCPLRNWCKLKEMIAKCSALLWVLFGDVCPYMIKYISYGGC